MPLERPDDAYGYVPSQKLSDIIKSAGFDGVRYRSAMEPKKMAPMWRFMIPPSSNFKNRNWSE
jgi:hypothetical protein